MVQQPAARSDSPEIGELDSRCLAWLEQMSAGSEQALMAFYDATLPRVFGVAVRIVGNAALAEDVVADVYHDAWRKAASFDRDRGRPLAWLLTICRNRALDERRRESSVARKTEAAATLLPAEAVEEPDDLLEAAEQGHAVHALLSTIPPEDRQLIALAFFRDLSHQQIADVSQLPLGTVKSRLRRSLKMLRDGLTANEQE